MDGCTEGQVPESRMTTSLDQQPSVRKSSGHHGGDWLPDSSKRFTGKGIHPVSNDAGTSPIKGPTPRKSGYNTSTEDEDERRGSFDVFGRTSSHHGISFSIAGPVQAPEGDWNILADAEAAKKYAAKEHDIENGGDDITVAVEVNGSNHAYGRHSSPLPVYLKFEDVRYKVSLKPKTTSPWRFRGKPGDGKSNDPKEKEILRGINGSVAPGEVLALMGPSGSGKTTLLNVLAGRLSHDDRVTGSISYNGMPYSKNLKRRMGFVTQDDVLYPHLTVRETLMYAALLRLPNSLTKQQKIERSEEIIQELGLERCRDTIIGGPFLRGISGGERKRVCIGHEILIDPSLLFLDEPTSGLDSTIALRIIQVIQSIAQGGRTVVASIHQPSTRLFYMFNTVLLLSEGHTIYSGKAVDAMDYFSSIHFSPAMSMNPADFMLDLANGILDGISTPPALATKHAQTEADQSHKLGGGAEGKPSQKQVQQYLVEKFKSQAAVVENKKLLQFLPSNEELKEVMLEKREWSTTWWQQFNVLLIRGLKERRHEYLSWLRTIQVTVIAVIVGLLWWQSKSSTENHLLDQVGLVFFLSIFWAFFPLFTSIFTFPQERAMLAKERASDMYRLSAYFLSRTLGDAPMDMLLVFLFIIIVYFMTHLHMSAAAFFLTTLTIILDVVTSQGLGLCIGAVMMDVKKSTTMASIIMLTFMLTGGFYVQHIPVFIRWLKYFSFNYHCFKLLLKVQYNTNQKYECSSNPGGECSISTSPALHNVTLGGGGTEAIALLIMVFAYRILGYIALRRMKTNL